ESKKRLASTPTPTATAQQSNASSVNRRRKNVYSRVVGPVYLSAAQWLRPRRNAARPVATAGRRYARRFNSNEPFVPPKPKEFDSTVLIFISRAACGT